jgi:hypothetical protein
MSTITFRDKYCERFGCPKEAFAESVFWKCFYPRCKSFAGLLWWFNSDFFKDDLEFIRSVADTTSFDEMQTEIADFRINHTPRGFLRTQMLCRVSGQKLTNLGSKLFKNQDGGTVTNGGTDFTPRV